MVLLYSNIFKHKMFYSKKISYY